MIHYSKKIILISLLTLLGLGLFLSSPVYAADSSGAKSPQEVCDDLIAKRKTETAKVFNPETKKEEEKSTWVEQKDRGFLQNVSDKCYVCGDCTLCDMIAVFVGVANIILASLGGIALIVFLWGAFTLVMSGGKPEAIKEGKAAIRSTIVGLLIVLLAWQVINSVMYVFLSKTTTREPVGNMATTWFHVQDFCGK